jgi:hypothetical protein
MPYAFAHPAAVLVLPRVLGGHAVPSALAIGSVIPDAWYFLPFLGRDDSHSLAGLLLFCLPAGWFVYAAFHLILKRPLLALLTPALGARLARWTRPGLPAAHWRAVAVSLTAGALTHYAWDAFTHPGMVVAALHLDQVVGRVGPYPLHVHQVLQHASTLLGGAFLAGWLACKLRAVTPASADPALPAGARRAIGASLAAVAIGAFCAVLLSVSGSELHPSGTRSLFRAAAVTAVSALGLALLAYCVLWRLISSRGAASRRASRAPASTSAS